MNYLFIDSTYDLILGVLDDRWNWLSFERHYEKKASAVIQSRSFDLLAKHNIKAQNLSGIITVNGPGFYTGLRLAEGFSDVFKFFGVKQYSLYSYEIPFLCGHDQGIWFTKAYRGEYFLFHWDKMHCFHELLIMTELDKVIGQNKFFIHSDASLDKLTSELIPNPIKTSELLQNFPQKIFSEVIKNDRKDPFYFRAPEDEFKVNP